MSDPNEIKKIETAIKELDLDYMRGLLSEEEYNRQIGDLRAQLREAGGVLTGLSEAREALTPAPSVKPAMTDPVTAVKTSEDNWCLSLLQERFGTNCSEGRNNHLYNVPRGIHRVLDEWQWNQWVSEEISALEL
jgi:hypothetical protein